jgi:hypothetical protein
LKFAQIKGKVLFKGEIIAKIRWFDLKYFFSRIPKPEKLRLT